MKDLEKRLSIIEEKLGIVNGTPKLEVGNWYWLHLDNDNKLLFCFNGTIAYYSQYGFNSLGNWSEKLGIDQYSEYTEATPKEVKEALVRHAELKYSGKKGECLHTKYDLILEDVIKWDWDNMSLRYQLKGTCWGCVFCLGEWAEVIEQTTDKFSEPQQSSLEQDIQQLKDKYKQYRFTITIEENI